MRITARRAIAAILVACGILVGLLFVSLNTIINKNRENIQAQLQKAMGRSVTFDSVNVGLWGGLGLSVKDLQIADDPRFAATPLIQTKDLKMEVRWLPLFLGNVEIQKLVLDEPSPDHPQREGCPQPAGPGRGQGKGRGKEDSRGASRSSVCRTVSPLFPRFRCGDHSRQSPLRRPLI